MKHLLSISLSMALLLCTACSDSEVVRMYGEPQVLADSEWLNITAKYVTESDSPVTMHVKEEKLNFGDGTFTMTTCRLVPDEEATTAWDTLSVTQGTYRYEHPTLWLTMEGDTASVEAWISATNHICYYDDGDFNEFERLE